MSDLQPNEDEALQQGEDFPNDDEIEKAAKKLARRLDVDNTTYKRFSSRLAKRLSLQDEESKERLVEGKKDLIQQVMADLASADNKDDGDEPTTPRTKKKKKKKKSAVIQEEGGKSDAALESTIGASDKGTQPFANPTSSPVLVVKGTSISQNPAPQESPNKVIPGATPPSNNRAPSGKLAGSARKTAAILSGRKRTIKIAATILLMLVDIVNEGYQAYKVFEVFAAGVRPDDEFYCANGASCGPGETAITKDGVYGLYCESPEQRKAAFFAKNTTLDCGLKHYSQLHPPDFIDGCNTFEPHIKEQCGFELECISSFSSRAEACGRGLGCRLGGDWCGPQMGCRGPFLREARCWVEDITGPFEGEYQCGLNLSITTDEWVYATVVKGRKICDEQKKVVAGYRSYYEKSRGAFGNEAQVFFNVLMALVPVNLAISFLIALGGDLKKIWIIAMYGVSEVHERVGTLFYWASMTFSYELDSGETKIVPDGTRVCGCDNEKRSKWWCLCKLIAVIPVVYFALPLIILWFLSKYMAIVLYSCRARVRPDRILETGLGEEHSRCARFAIELDDAAKAYIAQDIFSILLDVMAVVFLAPAHESVFIPILALIFDTFQFAKDLVSNAHLRTIIIGGVLVTTEDVSEDEDYSFSSFKEIIHVRTAEDVQEFYEVAKETCVVAEAASGKTPCWALLDGNTTGTRTTDTLFCYIKSGIKADNSGVIYTGSHSINKKGEVAVDYGTGMDDCWWVVAHGIQGS